MKNQDKKQYELSLWFLPNFEEKEIEIKFNDFLTELKNLEIEILNSKFLEKKSLMYPIKKEEFGFFSCLAFKSEPSVIQKIEEKLRSNKNILRYLITVLEVAKPAVIKNYKMNYQNIPPVKINYSSSAEVQNIDSVETDNKDKKISLEDLDQKLEDILKL